MSDGLALHTTTGELGLAAIASSEPMRSQVWDLGRSLSTELHSYLAAFLTPLAWTDLDFLAVAKGPGGFTGTRIGVVTARTLAQQLDLPLFAISTLAAVAWQQFTADAVATATYAIAYPARRGELFGGIYTLTTHGIDPTQSQPDAIYTPEQWADTRATLPPHTVIQAPDSLAASVAPLLDLAARRYAEGDRPHWSAALPFYGQHPVTL
ncbi:tRNA (adenosine(37)-N6)-threonylcarbamoyltransferase complex dimerization subunit type 1 TsaB [Spirulina major]|uniref:tRNA (adenosine(37)-N6)-threonylcarbamoyltransferase complex dimerization subunit type 1 TsaB n=1 Tax=Spirulina major TaxID=270636 RepID=UPI000933F1F9|nr:tRNA (adenosine(37)-N6)-threonylcarbamoyltransferase complex dimerization subunit type 1 TsaB [Spirulina major]